MYLQRDKESAAVHKTNCSFIMTVAKSVNLLCSPEGRLISLLYFYWSDWVHNYESDELRKNKANDRIYLYNRNKIERQYM